MLGLAVNSNARATGQMLGLRLMTTGPMLGLRLMAGPMLGSRLMKPNVRHMLG